MNSINTFAQLEHLSLLRGILHVIRSSRVCIKLSLQSSTRSTLDSQVHWTENIGDELVGLHLDVNSHFEYSRMVVLSFPVAIDWEHWPT